MRKFRKFVHGTAGRIITAAVMIASAHVFADPSTYLYALEVQRQKEANIREIAKRMNVDPEFLLHPEGRRSFDFRGLWARVAAALGFGTNEVAQSGSFADQIARVKSRYALVAADTTMAKIAELIEISLAPENIRGKNKGQIRAAAQSILRLVDTDFLPKLPDGLPSVAASRDAQMRANVTQFRQTVKSILNAPHALDDASLDSTLTQLRQATSGSLHLRGNGVPRWTKDPFPLKDAYKKSPVTGTDNHYGATAAPGSTSAASTPAVVPLAAAPAARNLRPATAAIAAEVTALAQQLATPAKAFAYVYDNIDWQSYGGVVKGALGALQEARGNDWDQALLLRDMLQAQGYQAQVEWGRVSIPIARAMNLAGTEDPMQAANLLATSGLDSVALMQNGSPIAVQFTHAWVRAFIPYVPNRGTVSGPADTWVRMDPSLKRYDYQAGIGVNVTWDENNYLQTSAVRPPGDFYADQVWAYIRANNLNCNNLSQVPKSGKIHAANYPFVPATLNARIEQLGGLAAQPPAAQMQTVSISVTDPWWGDVLTTYSANLADLWGKKLTLTFAPATADDAAIIASYGGLYNTPAYIVHLKAVFAVDDVEVAEGGSISPGADLSLDLQFHEPYLGYDSTHHDIAAGEAMTEVFDGGRVPDSLIAARMQRLQQMSATPATTDDQRNALLTEKLHITGLRYMAEVDDAFDFATGVRWHRWVKSAFEGLSSQRLTVSYNFIGTPVRVSPADHNLDVTRIVVGIVPITNDSSQRLNAMALAGLHSSYLEGSIWEEMEAQQGISATKALLLSRMAGQQLWTANSSNVDSVLASINLSADAESNIRGAVAQGRIAIVPSAQIRVNKWVGTGYILRDPVTGSATYPISGGFAGGSSTGAGTTNPADLLGGESWLAGSALGSLLQQYLSAAAASGQGPSSVESDPVNVASGNMYRTFTDFTLMARGLPVVLARTYNSRSTFNGPFGFGWTWNYGESVTRNADGSLTYRETDGTEHRFAPSGTGFTPPPGKFITVTPSGSGYVLRFSDGSEHTFDGNGLLVRQKDLNGNSVTIARDASGNPLSVSDAAGRTVLTFTVVAGKITQATDLSGRSTIYAYNGDDLASATDTAGKLTTFAYDLTHNLTEIHDPAGNVDTFDYDTDDRMFHHVDPTGAEEYFHYDLAGRQTVLSDRRGGDNLIGYDDLGRPTQKVDAAGNLTSATYDANNNRTSVTDSRGGTTTFQYDANGNVTQQVNPDQTVVTATYDSNSRLLTSSDSSGANMSNTYDSNGNLLTSSSVVNGVTQTTSNTYDSYGQLSTSTDANNNTMSYTWTAAGAIATTTDPLQNATTYGTDTLGRITSVRDAAGNEARVVWDGRDRITTATDQYGNTATMAYDDAGRQTSITTPRGTTRFTYDGRGRLTSKTDYLGNRSTTTYNAAGDVVARTDARGNTTRYEYDLAGRVLKITDGAGNVWTYAYCAALGSRGGSCATCGGGAGEGEAFCELHDPTGGSLKNEFDAMGRVIAVTDALGHTTHMQYDAAGRKILETDANGNATRYGYDAAGHLLSVTEANGSVTLFTYDKNGNKLSQKDANGNLRSWQYDALNRVIGETDALQRTKTYKYDGLGNLTSVIDAKNQEIKYAYNVHRLTTVTYPDNTTESYVYDTLGRRTSVTNPNTSFTFTYDTLDRITSMRNAYANFTTTYEYDGNGNRTKMVTPAATVTYAYDGKNRLATMTDTLFGKFTFDYDALDRRTGIVYANGIRNSYSYDGGYRLAATVAKDSAGNVVDAWSYQYDATGNRTSKTDMDGKAETYAYDNVYRLTEVDYAGGNLEKFSYDRAGNRLTRTDQTGALTNYTYDAANQLLQAGSETFAHDANGNVVTRTTSRGTTTLTYDFLNRITRITGPDGTENSKYGPDSRRIELSGAPAENGTLRPEYDLSWNPICDSDSNNGIWTYRLYAPGLDEPLAEWRRTNNRTTFLHHDAIGSVTAVTGTDARVIYRQSYTAFGQMSRTTDPSGIPPTRLGFTSRESSIASMMQYRAREYDSGLGRFLSQDPNDGSPMSPPSLHRYTYAQNNPARFIDPLGLYCIHEFAPAYVTPNFIKPAYLMIPSLYAPGVCIYTPNMLVNAYLYLLPMGFDIAGLGSGILWPHVTIRGFPTVTPWLGYSKSNVFSWHIGLLWMAWKVCLIAYDVVSSRHLIPPICIPYWLILLAIVLWYMIPYIILSLEAAAAAAAGALADLSPVYAMAAGAA